MKLTKNLGVLAIVAAALITAGCASPQAAADGTPIQREDLPAIAASSTQQEALADGSVSTAEYEAAFKRYSDCMADAGHKLVGISQAGHVIEYSVPAEAVQSGDDDRCYKSEYEGIDAAWQIAHEDESFTTKLMQACLAGKGITPAKSAKEVATQASDAGITPDQCGEYAEAIQ